jgi:hypothetical protein
MRPNPSPLFGPVPHYAGPPPGPVPPPAPLSADERAALEALTFDELWAVLGALLDECYRARRTGIAAPVPSTAVVRINGLLWLARRMTRGAGRRPPPIPSLPETAIISQFELAGPLQAARSALAQALDHRPKPLDPAWRGFRRPWRDPVKAAARRAQAG